MNYKKAYVFILLGFGILLPQLLNAQMLTSTTMTATQLVNNVLLGGGVTASNITASAGSTVARGSFTNGSTIGFLMDAGIILTTGSVNDVPGWNTSGMTSYDNLGGGDADLDALLPSGSTTNKSVLEFDFVPVSDTLVFNYIFASEEYPEFACGSFNDIFAFLLSGPNPAGGNYVKKNLALIPGTSTIVSVNTINPGVAGTNGSAPNCTAIDPNWASYNVYYNDNPKNMAVIQIKPDGYTDIFTASASVVAGQTYHIKMAIGDVGSISDPGWDSYVFLQSQSFTSPAMSVALAATPSTTICPGTPVKLVATVSGGTADYDYQWSNGTNHLNSMAVKDSITVTPAVTTTYTVTVTGTTGSPTTASVVVNVNTQSTAPTSVTAAPATLCSGAPTTLTVNGGSLGTGATWNWYTGSCGGTLVGSGATLVVNPTSTTTYYVLASGTCNTTTCASTTVTVNAASTAPTNASASPATICSGASTTLSVSGGTLGTGASWEWYSGGCGTTPVGSGTTLVVSPTTNTTYWVLASGTCNTTTCVSTTVTVNTASTAPTSISATVNPICNAGSTTLSVNGGSLGTGAGWNWYTGGCGTSLVGSGASLNVSPASSTTYYVLASGTCNTTTCASLLVDVTTITPSAGTNQTICNGATTTLTASGGGTYEWSELSQTTPNIVVTPATTTTYTVTVTVGSCTATSSVVVNVTSAANATITPAGPFCLDAAATTLTSVDPGGTWTGTGITNAATGVFDPATAGLGTHQIIYTISGSCGDADTIQITVNAAANATVTPAGPFCSDAAPVLLSAVDPGGTWSGSGITNTSTGQFSPASVGVGTYQVIYTIPGACGDADTISIVVNLDANASITPAGPFCSSDSPVNLTAAQAGGLWSGTGITNAAAGTFSPATAGIGTHQIIYTISGACSAADTVYIVVNAQYDATITTAGPFCLNEPAVNLTAATADGTWSGTGISSATLGTFNPLTAGAGVHVVTYTISGTCGNSDNLSITVYPIPTVTTTGTNETCMGAGDGTVSVTATGGTPAYVYAWSNSGNANQMTNLAPATYVVTVTDANGCAVINSAIVAAATNSCETYDPHIFVPNIFSPNGDTHNDVLYVLGKGIKSMELIIFDRWGEKVFETKSQDNGWDGTFNGKAMDAAVFVYYLKAVLENDEKVDLKGNITLVR